MTDDIKRYIDIVGTGGHSDEYVQESKAMIQGLLAKIDEHMAEIKTMVASHGEAIEPWVQNKLSVAAENVETIYDFLKFSNIAVAAPVVPAPVAPVAVPPLDVPAAPVANDDMGADMAADMAADMGMDDATDVPMDRPMEDLDFTMSMEAEEPVQEDFLKNIFKAKPAKADISVGRMNQATTARRERGDAQRWGGPQYFDMRDYEASKKRRPTDK